MKENSKEQSRDSKWKGKNRLPKVASGGTPQEGNPAAPQAKSLYTTTMPRTQHNKHNADGSVMTQQPPQSIGNSTIEQRAHPPTNRETYRNGDSRALSVLHLHDSFIPTTNDSSHTSLEGKRSRGIAYKRQRSSKTGWLVEGLLPYKTDVYRGYIPSRVDQNWVNLPSSALMNATACVVTSSPLVGCLPVLETLISFSHPLHKHTHNSHQNDQQTKNTTAGKNKQRKTTNKTIPAETTATKQRNANAQRMIAFMVQRKKQLRETLKTGNGLKLDQRYIACQEIT